MASRRSTHSSRNPAKQIKQARDARIMADHEVPEDLEEPLSYEDALRYLRRQKLLCRGPLAQEHVEHAAKLFKQGRVEAALQVRRLNRGVRNQSTGELELCGYDFVDLIEATKHPLDGADLSYKCPKCGNEGTMRPARFNLIDAPDRAKHERLLATFVREAAAAETARAQKAARIAQARG